MSGEKLTERRLLVAFEEMLRECLPDLIEDEEHPDYSPDRSAKAVDRLGDFVAFHAHEILKLLAQCGPCVHDPLPIETQIGRELAKSLCLGSTIQDGRPGRKWRVTIGEFAIDTPYVTDSTLEGFSEASVVAGMIEAGLFNLALKARERKPAPASLPITREDFFLGMALAGGLASMTSEDSLRSTLSVAREAAASMLRPGSITDADLRDGSRELAEAMKKIDELATALSKELRARVKAESDARTSVERLILNMESDAAMCSFRSQAHQDGVDQVLRRARILAGLPPRQGIVRGGGGGGVGVAGGNSSSAASSGRPKCDRCNDTGKVALFEGSDRVEMVDCGCVGEIRTPGIKPKCKTCNGTGGLGNLCPECGPL